MGDLEYAGELSISYVSLNREFREHLHLMKSAQDEQRKMVL